MMPAVGPSMRPRTDVNEYDEYAPLYLRLQAF